MANFPQAFKPSKLNLDKSAKYLKPDESFYLLNHDINNSNAFQKGTPLPANFPACDLQLPAGENYSPMNYYSPITNENYTWHYNSNVVHFISRISEDGNCEIVYEGSCLQLSADPKHEIKQWRAILDVDYLCNKVPGGKLKRLVWVDGTETPMASLDVEAAIATNFFTTPFFDLCSNPCDFLQMCVPEVDGCIQGDWVPFTNSDKGKANLMLDMGIKVAIRHIYYDGRASEVSDRSILYYQDAKGCFDNTEGLSRCMKFRIPVGNPMVEKIEFYVSENGGINWYLRDTIDKYKKYNSSQQYWYQRDLAENVISTFSNSDCSFDYIFCNDTPRIAVDPKLFTRVTNPIPREAQGIIRIRESIAAYNYKLGTCPIDKSELDKITVDMECEDTSCSPQWATVTVRAIIYNPFGIDTAAKTGYIYRSGGAIGADDDLTDIAHFGMGYKAYEQTFQGEVRNFMPYIEGTNYAGVMTQWFATPGFSAGNRFETGILSGVLDQSEIDRLNDDIISNGSFFFQEYKFKVPRGMKGFVRIASHYKTNALGANQNTSTQVEGMLPAGGLLTHTGNSAVSVTDENVKEMYFDTCNGDVDNFDAFVISDLIYSLSEFAYSGYITDKNSQSVAGARIFANSAYKITTDYNGFYYFADNDNDVPIIIAAEQGCVGIFTEVDNFGATSIERNMAHVDHEISSETYKDNFLATVNIPVTDCANLPVSGVRVAISGGKYRVTDSDGVAHFKLRNYNDRNRSVVAVVMDKNNCFILDCADGCNPCMPSTVSTPLAACFQSNPTYTITPVGVLNTENIIANKRSLKKGGVYDMAIVIEGDCGQISAAYELKKFNVPKIQETGGFSVCRFNYNTNGAIFPSWAKKGKFVRSVNLSPFTLQWVVDAIDRTIDNKIILTIQSLNDYNKQFNFKTNTVYQFAQGDRVEFIQNGDGVVFDSTIYGILNYQILSPFNDEALSGVTDNADFFNQIQIADNAKLDGLTEGAIIEIQPLALATTQVTYFEICANFEIVNGIPLNPVGTFETFDTYLVNRQIGTFPPRYFEHKSPSDFWGEITIDGVANFISDIGKAHFVNPYENEKRYPRNFSINSATQMNYFGDFIKTLDAEEQGAIIAVNIKDDKIGLALCENDNFLFQISDDFLRVANNGIVVAAPVDSIISNPDAKARGEYGVSYEDIGGVYFGDGFAFFPSGKNNTAVLHNYSLAQVCGLSLDQKTGLTETSCNSFFQKRMRQKANFNKTATNFLDHFRWSVGQNKINNVIYLTLKSLRHSGVNNGKFKYEFPNETIMYSPVSDVFLGFCSYTPEGYSEISLSTDEGCAFLTFQNSLPYIHPVIPDKWNEFYGIAVDELVGITVSAGDKVVVPISAEIQSRERWFVHNVSTDNSNFRSEVPPVRVKRSNDKWNFAFLNDINSRGGLYNGSNARSYYVNVLLIKDNSVNSQYGSIDDAKRTSYNELDSILIKSIVSEQAGFTANV